MQHSLIQFKDVRLGYGRKTIVSDISFNIHQGDFLGIVGPNGAGKTTILRAILGILRPQGGEIISANPTGGKLKMGYVPQRDSIDPIMPFTVSDVVLMGCYGNLGLFKRPNKEDRIAARKEMRHVDVEDLADASFKDLSGGQKQRVLIARALTVKPDILILDEPTNGMDLTSRTAILNLVKLLHEEHNLTVLMVSHLLSDVANYVNRIALVEESYFQIGNLDEILTEQNLERLYGMRVTVGEFHGNKVVIAGGKSV
jgi:ABC-type Mn2+/Zn2+ transport system ATPase subunit